MDAGLGPFCLALHSHTSNKREFLDDLKARIDLRPADGAANELATVEGLLAEARKELTGHVERLHRTFGSLGLTAFDILWRARRLGGEIPEGVVAALRGATIPNVKMVTPSESAKHRATLQAFAAAHAAVAADFGPGETHPWHGMSRADLSFDAARVARRPGAPARARRSQRRRAARRALASDVGGVAWPDSPEGLLAAARARAARRRARRRRAERTDRGSPRARRRVRDARRRGGGRRRAERRGAQSKVHGQRPAR